MRRSTKRQNLDPAQRGPSGAFVRARNQAGRWSNQASPSEHVQTGCLQKGLAVFRRPTQSPAWFPATVAPRPVAVVADLWAAPGETYSLTPERRARWVPTTGRARGSYQAPLPIGETRQEWTIPGRGAHRRASKRSRSTYSSRSLCRKRTFRPILYPIIRLSDHRRSRCLSSRSEVFSRSGLVIIQTGHFGPSLSLRAAQMSGR